MDAIHETFSESLSPLKDDALQHGEWEGSRCKHELKYGLGEESLSLLGVYRVDMCSKVEKVDNCENRIPSDMIWTFEGSGPPGASGLEAFPLQMTMNIYESD